MTLVVIRSANTSGKVKYVKNGSSFIIHLNYWNGKFPLLPEKLYSEFPTLGQSKVVNLSPYPGGTSGFHLIDPLESIPTFNKQAPCDNTKQLGYNQNTLSGQSFVRLAFLLRGCLLNARIEQSTSDLVFERYRLIIIIYYNALYWFIPQWYLGILESIWRVFRQAKYQRGISQ